MSNTAWRQVYKAPHNGHRFFLRLINGAPEPTRRIAVADNSGTTPDRTEDGILWLDLNRKWVVSNDSFSIPLISERDGKHYWTGDNNDALFALLNTLRQQDVLGERALSIRCELSDKSGVAARALLKCLDLGIDP